MNYIQQINAFWNHESCDSLTSSAISVYFALLNINNSNKWKTGFRIDLAMVMDMSKIGNLKTLYKQLSLLKDLKLIDYNPAKNQHLPAWVCIKRLYTDKDMPEKKIPEQSRNVSQANTETMQEHITGQNSISPDLPDNPEAVKLINNKTTKTDKQEKENNVFLFQDVYIDFIKKRTGITRELTPSDYIALQNIIGQLSKTENNGLVLWKKLLNQWDKQKDFYRDQIKLDQIDKNLVNLLNHINNSNTINTRSHTERKEFNMN